MHVKVETNAYDTTIMQRVACRTTVRTSPPPGRRETCRAKLVSHHVVEVFYLKMISLREQRRNWVGRGARGEQRFRVQYVWIIRTEKVEKSYCANWRRSGSGENSPASESSFPTRRELGWSLNEPSKTVGRIIMVGTWATTDTRRADLRTCPLLSP